MTPTSTIVWRSPRLAPDEIEAVVCVPTFRRPALLTRTLASLAAQATRRRFAVLVAENDAVGREGAAVASARLDGETLAGLCLVESAQGNCYAINAAFETALTFFPEATSILMIDDDEVAPPAWLGLMLEAADRTGAEIVGGPVHPAFEARARNTHPVFFQSYDRTGGVPMIYGSGNCLIRRHVFTALEDRRFDGRFNHLGGGDTDFFVRCRRAGARFHWVNEASLTEFVPAERCESGWLLRRGLRVGAINYHIDRKNRSFIAVAAKNLLALPLSLVRSLKLYAAHRDALGALHPIAIACGRSLAAFGIEPHQYGARRGTVWGRR